MLVMEDRRKDVKEYTERERWINFGSVSLRIIYKLDSVQAEEPSRACMS